VFCVRDLDYERLPEDALMAPTTWFTRGGFHRNENADDPAEEHTALPSPASTALVLIRKRFANACAYLGVTPYSQRKYLILSATCTITDLLRRARVNPARERALAPI